MIDDNLSKGRIKVVIASDSIPDILRDTVSFINSFSNFEIFVMQVKSYMKGDMQIYAPTIKEGIATYLVTVQAVVDDGGKIIGAKSVSFDISDLP